MFHGLYLSHRICTVDCRFISLPLGVAVGFMLLGPGRVLGCLSGRFSVQADIGPKSGQQVSTALQTLDEFIVHLVEMNVRPFFLSQFSPPRGRKNEMLQATQSASRTSLGAGIQRRLISICRKRAGWPVNGPVLLSVRHSQRFVPFSDSSSPGGTFTRRMNSERSALRLK